MYPYFVYNVEDNAMVYNHDGTMENEIFIILDKKIHRVPTDYRLIDILEKVYCDDSMGCHNIVHNIVNTCMGECKFYHIQVLMEHYDCIYKSHNMF